jgi:excinuclease ABC subunit A
MGNSVVVIEHNLDVIKCADWIIDMGPGAGVNGGQVVFTGTPEELAAQAVGKRRRGKKAEPISVTAPFLAEVLATGEGEHGDDAVRSSRASRPNEKKKTASKREATAGKVPAGSASGAPEDAGAGSETELERGTKRRPAIARVDPAEDQKPSGDKKSGMRPQSRSTPNTVNNTQDNPESRGDAVETTAVVLEPWKALGKKWHSLNKGFADGETPEWPLEVAERTVKLLETIAGPDSIICSAADGFEVKPDGYAHAWAEVKTKEAGSLRITLAGPESAFDESGFSNLEMQGPVDRAQGQSTTITLNLKSLKHTRSRKLRQFLKSHLEQTLG